MSELKIVKSKGSVDRRPAAHRLRASTMPGDGSVIGRPPGGSSYRAPLRQGPVMAKVIPGLWMLANSQLPFLGSKVAPAHSLPV